MDTKRYRVRPGQTVNHNGTLLRAGAELDLTELQASDNAVNGMVELASPPAAAPPPPPAAPPPRPATKPDQEV